MLRRIEDRKDSKAKSAYTQAGLAVGRILETASTGRPENFGTCFVVLAQAEKAYIARGFNPIPLSRFAHVADHNRSTLVETLGERLGLHETAVSYTPHWVHKYQ